MSVDAKELRRRIAKYGARLDRLTEDAKRAKAEIGILAADGFDALATQIGEDRAKALSQVVASCIATSWEIVRWQEALEVAEAGGMVIDGEGDQSPPE